MIVAIIVGVILLAVAVGAAMYNGLVKLNVRADEAWSDITVQLKRRYDLIPNLISTVKGYAKHEADVLQEVAKVRADSISGGASSGDVKQAAAAENALTGALRSVFAVAESNPDLKANQNFLQLQTDLTDTEDKIQASRRFYNGVVRDFNTKRKVFPTNIFAGMLGFNTDRVFFELDEAQNSAVQNPVEVKF
ncbi:LemA family protein [Candidatus Saccharibacteria bacterium]|jgi:LemA protein|nr:LemA family protein [Candidatus Saccharibacteria bacterium]